MTYLIILSLLGCIFLFFLSLCAFSGMEALRIHKDDRVEKGFELLLSSLVSIYQ